jgi:hypothetical protein
MVLSLLAHSPKEFRMSLLSRDRVAVRGAALSALSLIVLAGWAGDPAPSSDAYAMVDGEKAAVPAVPMGDAATVARIIAEGKNNNQVWDRITYISNTIGPRLTGSSGVERANKWCRDQFEGWGLSIPPFGGASGQTSGDADLRGLWQWGEVSLRFDRGPSTGKVVALRNPRSDNPEYRTVRDMEFTTLAWTMGTEGALRAPVVKMPESDEQFEAVKDKVKGAWMLVKPQQPGRRGVVGGASARLQLFAGIRKKAGGADVAGDAAPAADKNLTRYEGTVSGGPMPDGMAFTLDVNLTDPKAVSGSFSLGGFRNSEIKDGTFNASTKELKFKTESPRGEREYTMLMEGDGLKGETALPENAGTIKYEAKKTAIEEPKKGPTMEERVLALQPGFSPPVVNWSRPAAPRAGANWSWRTSGPTSSSPSASQTTTA